MTTTPRTGDVIEADGWPVNSAVTLEPSEVGSYRVQLVNSRATVCVDVDVTGRTRHAIGMRGSKRIRCRITFYRGDETTTTANGWLYLHNLRSGDALTAYRARLPYCRDPERCRGTCPREIACNH